MSHFYQSCSLGGCNVIKKKMPAKSATFLRIPLKEHFWVTASIVIAWNSKSLSFSFFLPTFLTLIYWFFSSFGLFFSYLSSDYNDTNTLWILHNLYLFVIEQVATWLFYFEWISWRKQENSNEPFTYGLRKTLIHYILIKPSQLFKETKWCHCMPLICDLYDTDSLVSTIIKLVFRASYMYISTLIVHCMSSFLSVRPLDLQRRQLTVRF